MSTPSVLIVSLKLLPGQEDAFASWQAHHDKVIAAFPGFVSSDIIPPPQAADGKWTLLLNFSSADSGFKWQHSPEWARLIEALLPLTVTGSFDETSPKQSGAEQSGSIATQIIFSKIKPGMMETYQEWAIRMRQAQAKYPGYRGTYLQPPSSSEDGYWTTLLRYDTQEHLDAWLAAPERAELLRESKAFIETEELTRLATSFPGWVPVDPSTGQGPPNWKTGMLVLVGLFPIVMLEIRFLNPLLASLNLAAATFICNTISVTLTTFVTMPLFIRWLDWWLFVKSNSPAGTTARGVVLFLVLFTLEIALFLWL